MEDLTQQFLDSERFAVVGASNSSHKVGAQVFAALLHAGLEVYPINPSSAQINVAGFGPQAAFPNLASTPKSVPAVSIITPPAVTEGVVEEAAQAGAKILWMQPGSESDAAIARAQQLGLAVIHGGPCILVALRLRSFG